MRTAAPPRVSGLTVRICLALGDELLPVALWLCMYGATRLAPALVLRFSMALPQVMDVPRLLPWQQTGDIDDGGASSRVVRGANRISAAADAAAFHLAELIRNAPLGASSDSADLAGGIRGGSFDATLRKSSQCLYHQSLQLLRSIVTYPARLWTYILFQQSQRASLRGVLPATHGGRSGRRAVLELLLRIMTSFTSTWVHASGSMLFNTLVTYLSARVDSWGSGSVTDSGDRRYRGIRNGWCDLLIASCVSTGLNFLLQVYWVEVMTSAGAMRALPPETTSDNASPLYLSDRMQFILSTLSRLGGVDSFYRLFHLALRLQPSQSSSTSEEEQGYTLSESQTSTGAGPLRPSRVESSSHTTPPTSTITQAHSRPAQVYLCGGSVFIFALSGFRFSYYSDPQQLRTSASNLMAEVVSLVLRQARRRAAVLSGQGAEALGDGQAWRPPASLLSSSSASSHDVVLATVTCLQLLPLHVLSFVVSAGVGLVWRQPRLFAVARRVPLLGKVIGVLFPLPPPPLELPEVFQELSPESRVLLVHPGGRVEVTRDALLPIVVDQLATGPTGPSLTEFFLSSGITSVVVAHDLFCPIKRTLMCDPVQTIDGFTYDRDSIEEWLWVHDTSPLTNLRLDSMVLRVNWQARQDICGVVDQYAAAMARGRGVS